MAPLVSDPRAQPIDGWHHAYEDCLDHRAWGGAGDFSDSGNAFGFLFVGGVDVPLESAGTACLSDARLSASFGPNLGIHPHR